MNNNRIVNWILSVLLAAVVAGAVSFSMMHYRGSTTNTPGISAARAGFDKIVSSGVIRCGYVVATNLFSPSRGACAAKRRVVS
jgi:hypothetical protein